MKIFDAHISGSLSVSSSAEISNDLLVSGNLNVLGTINGSISGSTTNADTASFAPKYSLTSSFNTFTSSYNTGSFTGSFKGDGSNLYNIPASGVTGLELNKIVNGSASASVLSDGTFRVNGDAYIDGTLTAKEIHTSIVTSSVLYESGSTKFGDTVDDTHSFTGSVNITGSISLNGQAIGTGKLDETTFQSYTSSISSSIGSLETASGSIRTTLNSYTSSNDSTNTTQNSRLTSIEGVTGSIGLLNTYTGSNNIRLGNIETSTGSLNTFTSSASGRLTSLESASSSIQGDFNSFTSSYNTVSGSINNRLGSLESFSGSYTGSFSGSFKGDGTNLFNIPASGVTGLNLTRIADGAATASISNTNGLRVNSNTEITGTLKLNKVNLGSNNIVDITLTDGGGKYFINGLKAPRLSFIKGFKYRFYYNNIATHPLLFSLTSDGEHNGGTIYTTGVTTNSDPFYIEVDVTDATAATFYYWCDHHVGMGNSITVYSDFLHGQSSIGLINVDTTALATTGSNNFTNIQRTSGSLVVTGSVDITGSITLNGQAIGTGKLDETTFQSYTSSNDSRVSSLESSTGSLNTFTSSIDTTIKNKLNTETVISGSVQVLITGTTGYSTFSSSISTSIGSLSGSVATTTSGLSSSIGSLSYSVDSLSSSIATTTSGLSSSIATTTSGLSSSIGSLSYSVATTTSGLSSSIGSLSSSVATTTLGLSSSIGSLSSSIATTTLGLSSSIGSLSSSVATTTLNLKNRVDSIETSTGSLNSFTSSINTTIKDKMNSESVLSGSIQVNLTGTTGYGTFSSSIATTTNDLSTSIATTTSGLSSSIGSLSSSVATTTSGLSSSIGSLSSSIATTTLGTKNRVDSIEAKTGSYATTGSNNFQGTQTITGSLYISQNLIVQGSSSLENITASAVSIGTNTIVLNTDSPAFRYAGISVFDSGSTNITASLFYDSLTNQWKFKHVDTGTNDASIMLFGPLGNDIDNAPLLDGNYLTKVENNGHGHHLTTSNIFDNGSKVSINSNTEITGTLNVTGNIINPNITAIQSSTGSLNTFTASLLSAIELTGSNLTVRGNLLVKGTTTNVNTSTLDVDNNLINLNGAGAANAGLRIKDTTGVSQLSGSLLWDATNDYWIAGQLGSEQRLVRETEFNNAVTRIGNVESSTGSLNSFTSSINTTIKSKLNSDGVLSGSIQVNHNATTNYVANQHIDHTTVSITAGSGLTGGGDISSTRTINVGAGNGITVNADDIAIDTSSATFTTGVKSKLNADGVVSGSSQIDGSQLGLNKTITIGSTSTTLGGTSTTLVGLTSVTSTALTGSLQGSISGNAGTVTNGVYTTGDQTIGGIKTFSSAITASNYSGTHTGASSGTNTGDETLARVNALAITTVGTIGTGVWNGSSISTTYTAAKVTSVSSGTGISVDTTTGAVTVTNSGVTSLTGTTNQVTVSANTGGVTLSLPQSIATTSTPTFAGVTSTYLRSGTATSNLVKFSSGAGSVTFGNSFGGNATDTSRTVYFRGTSTASVWWGAPDVNGDNVPHGAIDSLSTGGLTHWYNSAGTGGGTWTKIMTVDSAGVTMNSGNFVGTLTGNATNITASSNTSLTSLANLATVGTIGTGVWNGSSIATTYTAAKVTAVNAGTGVGVDTTTGSVTVSIGQSVATSAVPTFKAAIFTSDTDSRVLKLRELASTSGNIIQFQDSAGNNKWEIVGRSNTDATPFYIYKNDGTNTGYIFSISGGGIPNFHTALTIGGSTAKSISNSSYSTSFSSVSSVTVTHSLGTKDVAVFVYDSSDNMFWPSSIVTTSTSVVTITFASSRSGRVVVVR